MSDVITRVNTIIWPFAILLIGFVVVQASLFLRHALKFNKKHELFSSEEIKEAIRTSAIATIGPAFSVVIVVLTLIPLLGAAVSFMRCGVIGAADFELLNANIAAETMGLSFGSENFTESAYTVAIFGMTFASAPYMIHLLLTCKPLDKAIMKENLKKRSFVPMLSMAAEMGFIGYWALDQGGKSVQNTAAIIAGLITAILVGVISQKSNIKKLKDWTMAIAMIGGMIGASVVNGFAGV